MTPEPTPVAGEEIVAEPSDAAQGVLLAGVQLLESLAPLLATGQVRLTAELRQRTTTALRALLAQVDVV